MDFETEFKSIKEIITAPRQYVIPRFQREYVWRKEQVDMLWEDIWECITFDAKKSEIQTEDYFLGTIVTYKDKNDPLDMKRYLVDGQQRLITLTIIFSVLESLFKEEEDGENLSAAIFTYVIGKDDNGKEYEKILCEEKKPFFQNLIQKKDKNFSTDCLNKEEERIRYVYNFFYKKLKRDSLIKYFKSRYEREDFSYSSILQLFREQILRSKIVYVTTPSPENAYTIFSVLNAKGTDLTVIDIIKNYIFSVLTKDVPLDDAREAWSKIKSNTEKEDIKIFYRHFWLSKYKFVTEKNLVKEFVHAVPNSEDNYRNFLNDLESASEDYKQIINPVEKDWSTQESKPVYSCLYALTLFKVTQVRTLLLSLFYVKNKKLISHKSYLNTVRNLEYFHFVFTAICSSRASGLESKYSSFARKIRSSTDQNITNNILQEMIASLNKLIPNEESFKDKLMKLEFTLKKQKKKKIIQYILNKIEDHYHGKTNELKINNLTIEHIVPKSSNEALVGMLGNLLPLGPEINGDAGAKSIKDKIPFYKKSQFKIVKEFLSEYGDSFSSDQIKKRTEKLAKILYDKKTFGLAD